MHHITQAVPTRRESLKSRKLYFGGRGSTSTEDAPLRDYMKSNHISNREIPKPLRISTRERVIHFLDRKLNLVRLYEISQALVSFAFAVVYIVESYVSPVYELKYEFGILLTNLILCGVAGLTYLIGLVLSSNPLRYIFFDIFSYLEYATLIPLATLIIILMATPNNTTVIRWYQVIRVLVLLRLAICIRVFRKGESKRHTLAAVTRRFTSLLLLFLSFILVFAGIIQTADNAWGGQRLALHDSIYFIWVTMATIGYGDITLKHWVARYCLILFFLVGIVVIPYLLTVLYSILIDPINRHLIRHSMLKNHVIVTGCTRYTDLVECIKEFFHREHGKTSKMLLLIKEKEMYDRLRHIPSSNSFYSDRVILLQGDIMDHETLTVINADRAEALFLLTSGATTDPRKRDMFTLMATLAVKNFNPKLRVLAQVLLPESKSLLAQAGASTVICTGSLKLKIMSLSMICPGASTLISNLITTYAVNNAMEGFKKKLHQGKVTVQDRWIYEYLSGLAQEIYTVQFSSYFVGKKFLDCVGEIYQEMGIILFAVHSRRSSEVFTNPSDYVIEEGDYAICMADTTYQAYLIHLYKNDRSKPMFNSTLSIPIHPRDDLCYSAPYHAETMEDIKIREEEDRYHALEQREFENMASFPTLIPTDSLQTPEDQTVPFIHEPSERLTYPKLQKLLRVFIPARDLPLLISPRSEEQKMEFMRITQERFEILSIARNLNEFVLRKQCDFTDHIIISGSLKGAATITLSLRSSLLMKKTPIIFMSSDEKIIPYLYSRIKFFNNVYFMRGSSSCKYDLIKARADNARCLVYITNPIHASKDSYEIDSRAVKAILGTAWVAKNTQYLCEITHRSNMKYLKPVSRYSWHVFEDIIDERLAEQELDMFERNWMTSEVFSSGRVFPNSVFTRLLCQSYYNPNLVQIIESICGFIGYLSEDAKASIFQVNCPPCFAGTMFGNLYKFLIEYQTIALGLYRPKGCNGCNNSLEYVFTNPASDTVLDPNDKIFVIAQRGKIDRLKQVLETMTTTLVPPEPDDIAAEATAPPNISSLSPTTTPNSVSAPS